MRPFRTDSLPLAFPLTVGTSLPALTARNAEPGTGGTGVTDLPRMFWALSRVRNLALAYSDGLEGVALGLPLACEARSGDECALGENGREGVILLTNRRKGETVPGEEPAFVPAMIEERGFESGERNRSSPPPEGSLEGVRWLVSSEDAIDPEGVIVASGSERMLSIAFKSRSVRASRSWILLKRAFIAPDRRRTSPFLVRRSSMPLSSMRRTRSVAGTCWPDSASALPRTPTKDLHSTCASCRNS